MSHRKSDKNTENHGYSQGTQSKSTKKSRKNQKIKKSFFFNVRNYMKLMRAKFQVLTLRGVEE